MNISILDWAIIISFFVISMLIGVYASKSAGKNAKEICPGGYWG